MSTQEYKVILNAEKEFTAIEGESIFNAALRAGIIINHSCLSGRCNSCIAKLEVGETNILKPEEGLSTNEVKNEFILTCSRSAMGPLKIKVNTFLNKVLEKPRTFPAKVKAFRVVSNNVMELQLRLPPNQSLKFEPGQYVNLIRGSIKRSYSLATTPDEATLCFYIKNYQNGKMSNYLFNSLKLDDMFRIEGPIGTFFFRPKEKRNIIFLATGTGIAPVKSILDALEQSNGIELIDKKIFVFWGNRFANDFFWKPNYTKLNIQLRQCLSRSGSEPGDNAFKYGYIQDLLVKEPIDLVDSIVYACGSGEMIKSAKSLLTENGLEASSFYSDSFVVSN